MSGLIKKVKLSKKKLVVGESLGVDVQVSNQAADVVINGVYGAKQYLQFRNPGSYTVVVTAALRDQIDQVGEKVEVSMQQPDAAKLPVVWATQDRYQPRTLSFSVANAEIDLTNVVNYAWDFGDGTYGASQSGGARHDYTSALQRDRLYTSFDVQVDAHYVNGFVASAKRTVAVFNTYGFNKTRRKVLTPRVSVLPPISVPFPFFIPNEVVCSFTVTNLEDEEISFTAEKHEWLTADPVDNPASTSSGTSRERSVARSVVAGSSVTPTPKLVAPSTISMDLRVPARSTITVTRVFPQEIFRGTVFGVAIHLNGIGKCSKLPAISSAYIEVKLPMQLSGLVSDVNSSRALSFLARSSVSASNVVTHKDLSEPFRRSAVAHVLSSSSPPAAFNANSLKQNQVRRPPTHPGVPVIAAVLHSIDTSGPAFASVLSNLTNPSLVPFDSPAPVVGEECDPGQPAGQFAGRHGLPTDQRA